MGRNKRRFKTKNMGEVRMQEGITFVCPFCKGHATVGYAHENVAIAEGTPTVLHSIPTCPEYDRLDVVDFIAAVNKAYGHSYEEYDKGIN